MAHRTLNASSSAFNVLIRGMRSQALTKNAFINAIVEAMAHRSLPIGLLLSHSPRVTRTSCELVLDLQL